MRIKPKHDGSVFIFTLSISYVQVAVPELVSHRSRCSLEQVSFEPFEVSVNSR